MRSLILSSLKLVSHVTTRKEIVQSAFPGLERSQEKSTQVADQGQGYHAGINQHNVDKMFGNGFLGRRGPPLVGVQEIERRKQARPHQRCPGEDQKPQRSGSPAQAAAAGIADAQSQKPLASGLSEPGV